jgi:ribosomal protein S18 acetylase RimI-like enzyme
MGNSGRFGKYGDIKRIERLRRARIEPSTIRTGQITPSGRHPDHKKSPSRKRRITIRYANTSDVDFIRRLSRNAFHEYGPYEEILPRWFTSGMTVTLVAVMSKEPVGFAMLGRHQHGWYSPPVSEMLAIAVDPGSRRLGIAELLMREIERRAGELQVNRLVLHTAAENEAGQQLFRKRGFIPSENKKAFYPGGQDALMMVKELP